MSESAITSLTFFAEVSVFSHIASKASSVLQFLRTCCVDLAVDVAVTTSKETVCKYLDKLFVFDRIINKISIPNTKLKSHIDLSKESLSRAVFGSVEFDRFISVFTTEVI